MSTFLGKESERASSSAADKNEDAGSASEDEETVNKEPLTTSDAAASFASYEDYLDSQITPTDLFYVEVGLFSQMSVLAE